MARFTRRSQFLVASAAAATLARTPRRAGAVTVALRAAGACDEAPSAQPGDVRRPPSSTRRGKTFTASSWAVGPRRARHAPARQLLQRLRLRSLRERRHRLARRTDERLRAAGPRPARLRAARLPEGQLLQRPRQRAGSRHLPARTRRRRAARDAGGASPGTTRSRELPTRSSMRTGWRIETVVYDNGTSNVDWGPSTVGEMRLFGLLGATMLDGFAGTGDLAMGARADVGHLLRRWQRRRLVPRRHAHLLALQPGQHAHPRRPLRHRGALPRHDCRDGESRPTPRAPSMPRCGSIRATAPMPRWLSDWCARSSLATPSTRRTCASRPICRSSCATTPGASCASRTCTRREGRHLLRVGRAPWRAERGAGDGGPEQRLARARRPRAGVDRRASRCARGTGRS